jgi:hypothetical protein
VLPSSALFTVASFPLTLSKVGTFKRQQFPKVLKNPMNFFHKVS